MITNIVAGFFISAAVFYGLNIVFPVPDMDQMDQFDVYGTFTTAEARRIGVVPLDEDSSAFGITGISVDAQITKETTDENKA